jgi:4-hydroxy 2-oxovalerate aldolase
MKVLDCTIRDGGYINNWNFSKKDVMNIYKSVSDAGVDYIEIGFISPEKKGGKWNHLSKTDVTSIFKDYKGIDIGVMINYNKPTLEIPDMVKLVRVAVHRDKALEAIDFTEQISDKGYTTSIQLMGFSTMSSNEINEICDRLTRSSIDYAYVADSYGSMLPSEMDSLLSPLLMLSDIKVGFHPHNSLQLAFANTLKAIELGVDIVDASILGMGRGTGNLPLELLLTHLRNQYNPVPILNCIEDTMKKYKKKYNWGYRPDYMLTGSFNLHPYYANQERDIERVWESLQEVSSKTVGYSQEVLDEIIDKEVDLKLTISPLKTLKIDKKEIEEKINFPTPIKKMINIAELAGHYHIFRKYEPYKESIQKLKNIHKGERCFIIATGPSLNKTNLNLIKDETLFGVNTLYRGLDKMDINLKYYVLGDAEIFHSQHKSLLQTNTTMFLCGGPGHYYVNNRNHYDQLSNCDIYPIQRLGRMSIISDFSKDLTKGTYLSGSVTIHCLQVAYYLGFSEVYLIGCDCDYSNAHHFDGKRTIRREAPVMTSQEGKNRVFKGYEICKHAFEQDGRKVYNATVGGKLEVFERRRLEDL